MHSICHCHCDSSACVVQAKPLSAFFVIVMSVLSLPDCMCKAGPMAPYRFGPPPDSPTIDARHSSLTSPKRDIGTRIIALPTSPPTPRQHYPSPSHNAHLLATISGLYTISTRNSHASPHARHRSHAVSKTRRRRNGGRGAC